MTINALVSKRLPPIGHFFSSAFAAFLWRLFRSRFAKGSKTASMAVANRESESDDAAA